MLLGHKIYIGHVNRDHTHLRFNVSYRIVANLMQTLFHKVM